MMRALFAILAGLGIGFAAWSAVIVDAVPAPDPTQQNPDIYACCGFPSVFSGVTAGDLQSLNPISQKIRAGSRTVTWRFVEVCASGNMKDTFKQALADTSEVTGLQFQETASSSADVTVRATCGTDFVNHCGVGPTACLYPSWPYESTINAQTVMSTWYELSQVSVWEHEFAGHALGTWNEQYQLDGAFSPTPGLIDFMNTGAEARYSWPQNDVDRWERTMYTLAAPEPDPSPQCETRGYDPCTDRHFMPDGWSYSASQVEGVGGWYSPGGTLLWSQCRWWGGRDSSLMGVSLPAGAPYFEHREGFWGTVPAC